MRDKGCEIPDAAGLPEAEGLQGARYSSEESRFFSELSDHAVCLQACLKRVVDPLESLGQLLLASLLNARIDHDHQHYERDYAEDDEHCVLPGVRTGGSGNGYAECLVRRTANTPYGETRGVPSLLGTPQTG